jgi:hypothetical protein
MSTPRQRAANRANAAKSTGPRTPAGKAASSANALKSGIYAKSPVIPGENPADLEALRRQFHDRYQPQDPTEHRLVESLISNTWELQRLEKCRTQMWDRFISTNIDFDDFDAAHNLSDVFPRNEDHFTRLQRNINSCERNFHRSLTALQRLQSSRKPADPKPISQESASFRQKISHPAPQPPSAPLTPVPSHPYADISQSNVENEIRQGDLSRP